MKPELYPNHYTILGVSSPDPSKRIVSHQDIKSAYRRALLRHHPDKSRIPIKAAPLTPKYTMDELMLAYKTLINPTSRALYDRSLLTDPSARSVNDIGGERSLPGLETVDLDELAFDNLDGLWYRGCRCGDDRGFVITEDDLEEEVEIGEILMGCRGCSLWLRVTFVLVEDG